MKSRHFKTVARMKILKAKQDSIKPEPASNGKIRMHFPLSNAISNNYHCSNSVVVVKVVVTVVIIVIDHFPYWQLF